MRVVSTRDVPLEVLNDLKTELGDDFALEIGDRVTLLSAEPPSWITLISESNWWVNVLAAYVAVYVAAIVKEAGKDTWKNRGKALAVLRPSSDKIKKLATAVARALSRLQPNTRAIVGTPIPNEVYSTQLSLTPGDENDLAVEIAMFVYFLPALTDLLKTEGFGSGKTSGWVGLKLLHDGSLEVKWFDRHSLIEVCRIIPFDHAP